MSEIEAPADSVLGDGPFPSSYMGIFLLCHHMVKNARDPFGRVSLMRLAPFSMRAPSS